MLMMLLAVSANATTFKVTTTEDRKVGSLRWAIEQSNKEKALSNIVFDLPVGSVVTPDSTIDIKTSVVIDGQIDGGRIDISPVINEFRLFSMVHTELDSVVFQNLNIYEPKFEKEGHYTWHNSFIESDTTSGLLVLRNNHISKFQEMVVCRGNSLHIECYDCLCDSMYLDFFSNAKDIFGEEHNSSSWASLHVENSKFIYTYGPGFLQNGGAVGVTYKDEFINVYTENICGISNGGADTMIYRNCVFKSCKSDAIYIGCDDLCISKVVVDSCQIIKSGGCGFKYLLDGSDIIFTNNVVYGSNEMDMYCSRQYFTDHYSTLRMENNLFGSPEYGNVGVVVDASNTIIRNNVFYGIDGYSEYMGEPAYALFDEGSDTLLIENNSFGINGDVKAPNKNGDLWLESEYQLADWNRFGYDYDYDLIPQVTVKGNKFYQSSPKAIRIDSTKLNVTMSENLFLETKDSAICNVKLLSKPTITEIKRKDSNITIIGHVDSLAKIELFYTSGAPQTAEEFIDSIKTDENGGFEFSIPYNKLKNKEQLCFTATATYSDGSTSNLSEVYCCSDCHLDPTRKEYYVKTERTGDGDGSSWENAMSGEDFVKVLPDAVAGATFYVAEGEYDLKVLSGENSIALKNNLSVIGGYGKNSNGKMTTDPSKYHTSFTNGYFYVNNGIHVEFDGLRFVGNENLDYCGYYAPSSLQTKTYVTLKNSVFVANGQSSAIIANSGCVTKLINDTIRGVCEYGIRAAYCVDTLSVEGSVIYGASDAGVFCEQNIVMKTSVISNNANYGLNLKLQSSVLAILEDNIIGLDVNGVKTWGNGIGVLGESSGGDKIQFKGNIIAGNLGTGIKISSASASFEGNYIGTNKKFENLGNEGDGIYYVSRYAADFPSSIENANYVGFNGGNGISYDAKMAGGDISFNYIGITPQGNPMPNEGYGLYLYAQSRLAQNSISNIIGYNTAGGVYVYDNTSGSRISQNLFIGTKNKAIEYNATLVSVKAPVLTKVERDNSSFIISGTIDTTSNATIELFYTNGDPQTAHKYLGNAETNSDGDFEITVPISELAEYGSTLCFSATAIYSKQTSELSDPFCCESCGCSNDTIMKKDTIVAGDKFLGKTYTIGLYENIFENLTSKNGCDSVVNHTLIVKPSPSVKEYYVKTSSEGSGDGSDWDNAMGAEDFAFAFPLVPSGTKFYIAKGEYQPMYGTNGKVPTRNYDKEFFTKKCVSLYGGFPSSAKGTDLTNDPAKYHTILSGDFDNNSVYDASNLYADNRQEDAQNILHIIPEESGDIIVSGIEFKGTYQHSSAGSAAFNLDSDIEGVTCNIEKCTFSLAENGLIASPSSLNVTDCYFYNNSYNGASVITDECVLTNCTFEGNRTCYFGDGNVTMQNCTSMGEISAYDIDEFNFVNNTLVGDLKLSGNKQCTLTGNILGGVVSITDSPVTSSYNIYLDVNSENEFIASTDLVRSETDMMPSDGKIVLANHGGFTPTIALERDKLSDGTSIRFPLSKTTVITDQRGVARLENTCMGAYEIECSNDTTLVRDTIYVGEKFMDVTYSQVGVHDSIFENLKAKNGCDSVVMHTLLVKPDPTVKEYYVKTKREGKGDGSSWENAMDGEDFAAVLPLAPDGVTFYVAEGRYTPKYTKGLSIPQKPSEAYYEINSSVTIRGGYPSDAKTDAVSEPDKYITEFSGDNSNMFLSFAKLKDIVLDGLTIQNTAQAILMTTTINSIEINNSVFYNCSNSALTVPYEMSRLKIYNSKFLKNGMVLYIPYITSAEIDKCTFEENTNLLISAGSNSPDGYLKISNSDFTKNKGVKQINANIQSYFTNCHFSGEENPIINSSQYPTNIINSSFEKFNSYCLIGSAVIDSCLFKQNHVILFVDGEITMSNSYLLQNDAIPIIQTDKLCINSCTFTENYYPNGSSAPFMSIDSLKIFNSTFLNNHRDSAMFYVVEYFDIENNTILGSGGLIYYHQYDKGKCKGNIILLDRSQQYTYSFPSSVLENNIVGTTGKEEYLSVSDMKSILDTKEDGTFNLKNNGGFTPTIALKTDHLPDGTSIRFPLTETTVTEDQRGVKRFESTCMGAYELGSDTIQTNDIACLGSHYTENGWDINTAEYGVGQFSFLRDYDKVNKEHLTLTIQDNHHLSIDEIEVSPSICFGGRYGSFDFHVDRNGVDVDLAVTINNSQSGITKHQTLNTDDAYAQFSELSAGNYYVTIQPSNENSCISDTSFYIYVTEFDSVKTILNTPIYSSCVNESNASTTIALLNYHPSANVMLDGHEIDRYGRTPNRKLYYTNEYTYPYYDAKVVLDSLSVGNHILTISDYCGHTYQIGEFEVVGPEKPKFEISNLVSNLNCSSDLGEVTLSKVNGTEVSILEVTSDNYSNRFDFEGDELTIPNLNGGTYTFRMTNGDETCSDDFVKDVTISQPEPLKVDLMVNGIVCQDAVITAYVSGESGQYSYVWTKPNGEQVETSSNILANVGAGKYKCTVKDHLGCSTAVGETVVSELENLSELQFLSASVDETCFESNNAKILVLYVNNNEHQAVTCKLTNKATGEVIKSTTSMLYWGGIYLEQVEPGEYQLSLRYGTESCNLDLNEITKDIIVKAKAQPLIIEKPQIQPVTCLAYPNGKIDITVRGWEKGYTALFNQRSIQPSQVSADSVAQFSIRNLNYGTYTFEVNDDCLEENSAISMVVGKIAPYSLQLTPIKTSLECSKSSDGEVKLSVKGGNLGQALLSAPNLIESTIVQEEQTLDLKDLKGGSYTISYRSADASCPDGTSLSFTIDAPKPLALNLAVSGLGCDDMQMKATTTGETQPYKYKWSKNHRSAIYTSRYVCPYEFTMGDTITCQVWSTNGCDTIVKEIYIPKAEEMPSLALSTSFDYETCYGKEDAKLTAKVRASQKLDFDVPVTLGIKPLNGSDFETYTVTGNSSASHTFINLAPGKYVTEAHFGMENCSAGYAVYYDTLTIEALHPLSTLSLGKHDRTCINENNSYVTYSIDGWSPSHQAYLCKFKSLLGISLLAGISSVSPVEVKGQVADFKIEQLSTNTQYALVVYDICTQSMTTKKQKIENKVQSYQLTPSPLSKKTLDCNYSNDGSLILNAVGGYKPNNLFYQEGEEGSAVSITKDTVFTFKNLSAGTYKYHYKTTEENCSDEVVYTYQVSPRSPLSYTTTIEGEACKDQKMVAQVTGGNTPIDVAWYSEKDVLIEKDQNGTNELQGVGAGSFYYVITDAKGCEYKSDLTKANLFNPTTSNLQIDKITVDSTKCYGTQDGAISVNFVGNDYLQDLNIILYNEKRNDTLTSNLVSEELTFADLESGNYELSVQYAAAQECPASKEGTSKATVYSPDVLGVVIVANDAVCDTLQGGSVSATISGGTAPYTVDWYDCSLSPAKLKENHSVEEKEDVLDKLPISSSYSCEVTDKNGCHTQAIDTVTVGLKPAIALNDIKIDTVYVEDESCYQGKNGKVFVSYNENSSMYPLHLLLKKGDAFMSGVNSSTSATQGGDLKVESVAPDKYALYLDIDYSDLGCTSSLNPMLIDSVTINAVEYPLSIKNVSVVPPTCYSKPNGKVKFEVGGWSDKNNVSIVTDNHSIRVKPDSVKNQVASFNLDTIRGGQLKIKVVDVCDDSVIVTPAYGGITQFGVDFVYKRNHLKCSYSTDGAVEITVNGGVKDSCYLVFSRTSAPTKADTFYQVKPTYMMDNLSPGSYRIKFKSTAKNCPDEVSSYPKIVAPEPIVFTKAVEGVICENTRGGEFNFVPHRADQQIKKVSPDKSLNITDKLYFGDTDLFPEIASLKITGKGVSESDMDTIFLETLAYGLQTSEYVEGDENEEDEGEEEENCDYKRDDICISLKKDPLYDFWFKGSDSTSYTYPEKWIGLQSLIGTTYYVEAVDDSACVFRDSFEVLPPNFQHLKIDKVTYDAATAICHADKRYVEVEVSGGWGDYQYMFSPEKEDTTSTGGLTEGINYDPGDSTWYQDGKGFYRSYILDPDRYIFVVMDRKGCKKQLDTTILIRSNILVEGFSATDPCGSDSTNLMEVKVSPSSWYSSYSPYTYQIRYENDSLGPVLKEPTAKGENGGVLITDIPLGKIGVYVYDNNGCSGYTTVPIVGSDELFSFEISKLSSTKALCYGDATGAFLFNVMGANPPYKDVLVDGEKYKYQIERFENDEFTFVNPAENGFQMFDSIYIENLMGGKHILTIIDSIDCRKELSFEIEQPAPLSLSIKASSVCPGGDDGRVLVDKVSGGTSPYQYSLEENGEFSDKKFIDSKLGVERSMYVKDDNGCVVKSSNTAAVDAAIDWGDVKPDVLVSSWQDFDDVLAFIDVTTYDNKSGKIVYDSATVTPYGIELIQNQSKSDSISFEIVDPVYYTYGIPDTIPYVILWNGDTVYGPLWGIPNDIVAKEPDIYQREKDSINNKRKALNKKYEDIVKNYNKIEEPKESDYYKFLSDSMSIAKGLDTLRARERQNCTMDDIKKTFIRLVDENAFNRMTFVKLNTTLYDITSLYDNDSLLFKYNFVHTVYLSDCDLNTDYNFTTPSLYGIRVSENDYNPYKIYTRQDILEFQITPNPLDANDACTINITLSRKTEFSVEAYNMIGQLIEQPNCIISEPIEEKDGDGNPTYRYTISNIHLSSSAVMTIRTDRDAASKVVIVNN